MNPIFYIWRKSVTFKHRQDKTRHDKAWQGKARRGQTRQDEAAPRQEGVPWFWKILYVSVWDAVFQHQVPSGCWFNIKMLSYRHRNSHCGNQTILWPYYLHNKISFTGETTYMYIKSGHWTEPDLYICLRVITTTQRAHDAIITSLWRQTVVLTSWWRYYCVVCPLGSCF